MRFHFGPIDRPNRDAIVGWRYPPPYDVYDWDPQDDPDLLLVRPEEGFLAARDAAGALVGFACFGAGGQVPGGVAAGAYADPLLDVGLGLRPDLTGRGLGLAFVRAVLAEGRRRYRPAGFRLTVAAFNARAIRVYERAGFRLGPTVDSPAGGRLVPFRVMTRPDPAAECPLPGEAGGAEQDGDPTDA